MKKPVQVKAVRTTDEVIADISAKLDVLIAISLKLQENPDSKREKGDLATYLREFGLPAKSIASILDSSQNSIQALLSQRRTKRK